MTFDELTSEYKSLKIKEFDFDKIDLGEDISGLCINDKIYINSNLTTTKEKTCVLAEEIGHYYTSYGNILDQTNVSNIKQEKRARNWAYEKLVPLDKLISAFNIGVRNRHELALFLDVTEVFIEESIKHYCEKYGLYVEYGSYFIYFEPLGVLKRIER